MPTHQIQALFLGLAAILVLARVLGLIAARLGQPPVIGEIIAGMAMGPTLFYGQIASTLFPTEIRPLLASLANVGLALFMFIVGCELEHATVVERKLVPISVVDRLDRAAVPDGLRDSASTCTPATATAAPARLRAVLRGRDVGDRLSGAGPDPVRPRDEPDTRIGAVALASAALSDVLAWSLLAVAVTVSGGGPGSGAPCCCRLFVAVMFRWSARCSPGWSRCLQPPGHAAARAAGAGRGGPVPVVLGRPSGWACTSSSARSCSARSCRGTA